MKKIRIGGGQGFWGDLIDAPVVMAKEDQVDYICCDYLAELTLSIMRRQQERKPEAGYARDFITSLKQMLPYLVEKKTKVITNAGGMNVKSCVAKVKEIIRESGYHLKVGYVLGDDVRELIPQLRKLGITMKHMDTGEDIDTILPRMINANVYYGIEPIVKCLQDGADIIILGRSTDTAMFEAPLVYEFGWSMTDWDAKATGILAGHLCECGAQATGGNYDYDWKHVPSMENLGYPIAEVSEKGSLILTKTKNTGGLVTPQSTKEQLMYEIHDPSQYITPDVVADFSQITVEQIEKDHVLLKGVKGKPAPDTLKLCVGYLEGYRNIAYLPYSWPDALEKAKMAADILDKRLAMKDTKITRKNISYLGVNSLHGPLAPLLTDDLNEVVLRYAIMTETREEGLKLTPEVAAVSNLNGPAQGCFFGGRSRPSEVFALWPTLIPRDIIKLETFVEEV
jgi:hypothetical protein